jgi:TPR repeat protein
MYANGQGVRQDDIVAVYWYGLAAEQGHALAQYNLGGMYGSGRGRGARPVRAYMWMLLAADTGDRSASANKAIVAGACRPAEIDWAIDLGRAWRTVRGGGAAGRAS